uniref:Elongin-C n=1 Tax=Enterobius vermicularis TaxID=51028 RepID=A0A0N4V4M9_ENTVE
LLISIDLVSSGIFFAFSKLFLTVFEWYFLVYGGCEGPDAAYVKLISSDGHEFIIKKNLALTSGTIKAMLSGPGAYAENDSHVLQKVCQYFAYKVRFTNSATEIPEFHIAPEVALELLMAANFLDC